MTHRRSIRLGNRGFTLVELVVVLIIIFILVALLLPFFGRYSREAPRSVTCKNNLKQLALALLLYHDVHKQFPPAVGGSTGGLPTESNQGRLSGMVLLLPFMEETPLWTKISNPATFDGKEYPEMGPAPWVMEYEPWRTSMNVFHCPNDRYEREAPLINYAFCIGDIAENLHEPAAQRGVFAGGRSCTLKDISDGISNTILLGEMGTLNKRTVIGQYATGQPRSAIANPSLCLKTLKKAGSKEYGRTYH
jgi:prepilin-type N-terminal cleavage/methylation domain-containing protein